MNMLKQIIFLLALEGKVEGAEHHAPKGNAKSHPTGAPYVSGYHGHSKQDHKIAKPHDSHKKGNAHGGHASAHDDHGSGHAKGRGEHAPTGHDTGHGGHEDHGGHGGHDSHGANFKSKYVHGKGYELKEGKKVTYVDFDTQERINKDYIGMQRSLAPARAGAPERPGLAKLVGSAFNNVKNIARNAFDNSIGYVIAQGQNYRSRRDLKNNPQTKKTAVYLIPGLFQNIGSQQAYARQLRKQGHIPYHIHPNNGQAESERVKMADKQLEGLVKKTGAHPYAVISGHSDGAALGIHLVQGNEGKARVNKYKIMGVQARAPSVHGTEKMDTPGKRLLIPLAPNDNVHGSLAARRGAVENARAKPYAKVHVIAGEYDGLVTPPDAVYQPQHGKENVRHYFMTGVNTTHFGTSGGNHEVNQRLGKHIDDLVKEHKAEQEKGKMGKVVKFPGVDYGVKAESYQRRKAS